MAAIDVEALLAATEKLPDSHDISIAKDDRSDRRVRDRGREASLDYDRDRGDHNRDRERDDHRRRSRREDSLTRGRRDEPEDIKAGAPRSDNGSHKSRRRSRSREDDRRRSRRHRGGDGDYYRGKRGHSRSRDRSGSPHRNNHRQREDAHDRDRDRDRDRRHPRLSGDARIRDDDPAKKPKAESTPQSQPTEDERDRRTVFVQQLAARLRTRELKDFFQVVGTVNEAQIVKDRISGRSKGVGYVEFKDEESVAKALQLTGQNLLGIPIIVQLTEAEKNRQVRSTEGGNTQTTSVPFHRLYVGNIHFNVNEQDLQTVFEPFGELEFVQLQKDENGRSRGYGFVQFRQASQAKEALEKMNAFELVGRPIRVGLGNDKFTPESTANLLHRFPGQGPHFQGSAFSGAGGRGHQIANFDRAGGRDVDKSGGASALDDTDVAGVNFNNYSRDALMRKLARTDEAPANPVEERQVLKPKTEVKQLPMNVNMASRCVVLHNMFDPEKEEGEAWIKELEDDVRQEAEEKYGHVVHVAVDPNSKGDVYLKFDKVQGGENAIKGLNGRYFGGKMINASPVVDAVYSSLFSRTRAV